MANFYSQAEKKKALDAIAAGDTRAHVARTMKIDPSTIKRWQRESAEKASRPVTGESLVAIGAEGSALPAELKGALAKVLAEHMPKGTPAEVYKAVVMQKVAQALQNVKIPTVTKMSDFKALVGIANSLMGVGAAGSKAQPVNLAIRLDRLGSAPPDVVVEAEVLGEGGEEES